MDIVQDVHHDDVNNPTQEDPPSTNDDTLSDIDMRDDFSSFGPDDLATLDNDSNSSVDPDDFPEEDSDDEEDESDDEDYFEDSDLEDAAGPARPQTRHDVLCQTSRDLFDITKLLQIEFAKNPLSTQQILVKEAAGMYKRYGQHGSYLRLSENIMDYLNQGDKVVRPTTRREVFVVTQKNEITGEQRIIEKEELMKGLDRATMGFDPIVGPMVDSSPAESSMEIETELNYKGEAVGPTRNFQIAQPQCWTSIELRPVPGTGPALIRFDLAHAAGFPSNKQVQNHFESSRSDNEQQQATGCDQDNTVVQMKSIRELLPAEVVLNHDHPFTMTNDPKTHELLDPNNPNVMPFHPVDTKFRVPRGAMLAAGALTALNNIYRLTHLNAHHLLNYLTLKYTPTPTPTNPNPPAPPFALFRLGIQQLLHSNLKSMFTPAGSDPSGLTPQVRTLLKDLHQNHQVGRDGMTTLQRYHCGNNESRHNSWLAGREHLEASPAVVPTAAVAVGTPAHGVASVSNNTNADTHTNLNAIMAANLQAVAANAAVNAQAPIGATATTSNTNRLNHVERLILQRATGVAAGAALDDYWDELSEGKRGWDWLRCWVRDVEVKKMTQAKEEGKF